MHSHLVTIEIGIKGSTDQGIDVNGLPFYQDGMESLDP